MKMRDLTLRCIEMLLAAANDEQGDVRDQVGQSLRILAAKNLNEILNAVTQFLLSNKTNQTTTTQRFVLCKALVDMMRTYAPTATQLGDVLTKDMVRCSIAEMTATNDLNSDWAQESCTLCVLLCDMSPKLGVVPLLEPITSSALPHHYILKALSDFAELSPLRFLPFLKDLMSRLLPILALAKQDNHRMIFAKALASFATSVLQKDQDGVTDPLTPRSSDSAPIKRLDFADSMNTAVNYLTNEWTKSSDMRIRGPVLSAICAMSACMSDEQRATVFPKISALIAGCVKKEKPRELLVATKGAALLCRCVGEGMLQALRAEMDQMMGAILIGIANTHADKDYCMQLAVLVQNDSSLRQWAEAIAFVDVEGVTSHLTKTLDAKSGSKEPTIRAAAMDVVAHIINSEALYSRVQPFRDHLIALVKLATSDTDWRTRKAIISVVIAMGKASASISYFKATGANDLLHLLLKSSGLSDQICNEFPEASMRAIGTCPEEIRDTSRNALILFTSTHQHLDDVLWPFLLEHLGQYPAEPDLVNAFPTLCKALIPLAERKGQTDTFYIDFRVNVNVPKPGIIAQCFFAQLLNASNAKSTLSTILQCMQAIAPILDEPFLFQNMEEIPTPVAELWLAACPELDALLAGASETISASTSASRAPPEWEDRVCKIASKTMTVRVEAEWAESFATASISFINAYRAHPTLFRANLICAGIALGRCPRKDFVSQSIETIIDSADHNHPEHRTGVTKSLSFVAGNKDFVDLILEKYSVLAKGAEKKKGFFSFGSSNKSAKKELTETSRAIAGAGVCWAVRRVPQAVLNSRLDASVVPLILSVIAESPELTIRTEVMQAIPLLEQPLKKLAPQFIFKSRESVIDALLKNASHCMTQLDLLAEGKIKGSPSPFSELVFAALEGVLALITCAVQPTLSTECVQKIVAFVVDHFTASKAFVPTCRLMPDVATSSPKLTSCTLAALTAVMNNNNDILEGNCLLEGLQPLTQSADPNRRMRTVTIYNGILKAAVSRVQSAVIEGGQADLKINVDVSKALSWLLPRFVDENPEIRKLSGDGLVSCLKLYSVTASETIVSNSVDVEAAMAELKALRARTVTVDYSAPNQAATERELSSIIKALCGIVVAIIPTPETFTPVVDVLLNNGLLDPQIPAANCCGVVLHGMVRGLGGRWTEIQAKGYLEIMVEMIARLSTTDRELILNGLLVSVRNLTKHHSALCFSVLLKNEAPHPPHVIKAMQSAANDGTLSKNFAKYCLDAILNAQLVEDRPDPKNKGKFIRGLNPIPLSAACCLGWIGQVQKGAETLSLMRTDVFSTLTLYLAAVHDHGVAPSVQLVVEAFKNFVDTTSTEPTLERMTRYTWAPLLDANLYLRGVAELIKYIVQEELLGEENSADKDGEIALPNAWEGLQLPATQPTNFVVEIAQFVLPYANKTQVGHRRAAINVAGALLRHSLTESDLLNALVTTLLGRTGNDEAPLLRMEALQYFTFLLEHEVAAITPHVAAVLSAIIGNVDDPVPDLSLGALGALREICVKIKDTTQVRPIVVNVILKLKTKFERAEYQMRAAAFQFFGDILEMATKGTLDAVTVEQQAHVHLVSFIVHLEDDNADVRTQAKFAFRSALSFFALRHSGPSAKQRIKDLLNQPYMELETRTRYDELLNDLCLLWVADFAGRINDLLQAALVFFDSPWENLRGAAVALCGYMLKHIPTEDWDRLNTAQIGGAIVTRCNAQRERSAAVRQKAAKSMGLLSTL